MRSDQLLGMLVVTLYARQPRLRCALMFVPGPLQVEIQVKDLATAEATLRQELAARHSSGGGCMSLPCVAPSAKY